MNRFARGFVYLTRWLASNDWLNCSYPFLVLQFSTQALLYYLWIFISNFTNWNVPKTISDCFSCNKALFRHKYFQSSKIPVKASGFNFLWVKSRYSIHNKGEFRKMQIFNKGKYSVRTFIRRDFCLSVGNETKL